MIMKDFHATFTLTVMRRQATPLIMKDIPVTFTLTVLEGYQGLYCSPGRLSLLKTGGRVSTNSTSSSRFR